MELFPDHPTHSPEEQNSIIRNYGFISKSASRFIFGLAILFATILLISSALSIFRPGGVIGLAIFLYLTYRSVLRFISSPKNKELSKTLRFGRLLLPQMGLLVILLVLMGSFIDAEVCLFTCDQVGGSLVFLLYSPFLYLATLFFLFFSRFLVQKYSLAFHIMQKSMIVCFFVLLIFFGGLMFTTGVPASKEIDWGFGTMRFILPGDPIPERGWDVMGYRDCKCYGITKKDITYQDYGQPERYTIDACYGKLICKREP